MEAHLTHLFLQVGDLEKARWFWTTAIGLRIVDDQGGYVAVGGNGGFAIGLEQSETPDQPSGCPEISVRVEDAEIAAARLTSLGLALEGPPETMPWGAVHVWLRDPDGRRMSLYSTASPNAAASSLGQA